MTDAASGIGLATAQLLASRGAKLSICDTKQEALTEAKRTLQGTGHISAVVDVSSPSEVDDWIKTTVSHLGKLDGAANIAGVMRLGTTATLSDEDWDVVSNVNSRGVFYCLRSEIKNMSDGGSIVGGQRSSRSMTISEHEVDASVG